MFSIVMSISLSLRLRQRSTVASPRALGLSVVPAKGIVTGSLKYVMAIVRRRISPDCAIAIVASETIARTAIMLMRNNDDFFIIYPYAARSNCERAGAAPRAVR